MGVQLNIKRPKVRALAEELAKATGENVTDAIQSALEEKLARVRKLSAGELKAKWLAIGAEIRRRHPDLPGSADIDALLYDSETGLPK